MNHRTPFKILAACAVALSVALAGCSSGGEGGGAGSDTASAGSGATSESRGTIKLAYVEWDSCVAATNVAAAALEKAGYDVETISVSGALMFEGLANGDADAVVCAWLPTTHSDYYARTRDRVEKLGINMREARLGLAVPAYMDIDSITDLADDAVARELDNRIVGIDPGAGIMRLTHKVIDAYKLPEKLVSGSDATMTAVLADAIRKKAPVVVTSWKPHWMWTTWDLKFLDDPDDVYGKPDDVYTVARKGLKQDMPKAYAILGKFRMDSDARGEVMAADREDGADPMADARQWVEEHPDEVSAWLADGS